MKNRDIEKKVLIYSELLQRNEDDVKKELKEALENKNCEMVIDFELRNFTDEELKKYFIYIIENKKSKVIMLRHILPENYEKLKYFQNMDVIKNMR